MAIMHYHFSRVQRSKGRSVIAAVAYCTGQIIKDERQGMTHNYTKRRDVVWTELSSGNEKREALWNAADKAETRKNSQTAISLDVALPHELSLEENIEITEKYCDIIRHLYGCMTDAAIHDPRERQNAPDNKGDPPNIHAHIMATTRQYDEASGAYGRKIDLCDSEKNLKARGLPSTTDQIWGLRVLWADVVNEHLAAHNLPLISPLSLAEQGIDRAPQIHQGPALTAMIRKGHETRIGKHNAACRAKARQDALNALAVNLPPVPPTVDIAPTPRGELNPYPAIMSALADVDYRLTRAEIFAPRVEVSEHDTATAANSSDDADGTQRAPHADMAKPIRAGDGSQRVGGENGGPARTGGGAHAWAKWRRGNAATGYGQNSGAISKDRTPRNGVPQSAIAAPRPETEAERRARIEREIDEEISRSLSARIARTLHEDDETTAPPSSEAEALELQNEDEERRRDAGF